MPDTAHQGQHDPRQSPAGLSTVARQPQPVAFVHI